jgi:hypothetical protein
MLIQDADMSDADANGSQLGGSEQGLSQTSRSSFNFNLHSNANGFLEGGREAEGGLLTGRRCPIDLELFGIDLMAIDNPQTRWKTLDGSSKCFVAASPKPLSKHDGCTLSFAGAGMSTTSHNLLEVIFFFSTLKELIDQGLLKLENYTRPSEGMELEYQKGEKASVVGMRRVSVPDKIPSHASL